MGLEEDFYGSAPIRNFLKLYSEHNWNRVSKATLLIGICRLTELSMREGEGIKPLNLISLEDIEDIAVKMHSKIKKRQKESNKASTNKDLDM